MRRGRPCISMFIKFATVISIMSAFPETQVESAETVLHSFRGDSDRDGSSSWAQLTTDAVGNFYGTTRTGGGGSCQSGCGTVFKLSPSGHETVLHRFGGGNDGADPSGGLIVDASGNQYGTTQAGGGSGCNGLGCGIVFEIATDGKESVRYAFQGAGDGSDPTGTLAIDADGNLYGATVQGGNFNGSNCDQVGCGTVFELEPDGTKITLYSFLSGSDGSAPFGGVILGSFGNLYGTTYEGGSSNCGGYGCGTVFRIAPGGSETVLYAFQGGSDGGVPDAGVILDGSGNLYGTTSAGGGCSFYGYCGTVFKVVPNGTETVLYRFQGGSDGSEPLSSLVMDGNGNLYGTTYVGGGVGCHYKRYSDACGTVFELSPNGTETVLYAFHGKYGKYPAAGLLLGKGGALYGTTTEGGKRNDGVVFEVTQ